MEGKLKQQCMKYSNVIPQTVWIFVIWSTLMWFILWQGTGWSWHTETNTWRSTS